MLKNKCRQCGRPFYRYSPDGNRDIRPITMIKVDPSGFFCTMKCGALYGVAAITATVVQPEGGKA